MSTYHIILPEYAAEGTHYIVKAEKVIIKQTGQTVFYQTGGEIVAVAPVTALIVKL